jgi:hypothetical protein
MAHVEEAIMKIFQLIYECGGTCRDCDADHMITFGTYASQEAAELGAKELASDDERQGYGPDGMSIMELELCQWCNQFIHGLAEHSRRQCT